MAYVPDEAIVDSKELTPTAYQIFTVVCMARNKKRRGFWMPYKFVAARLKGLTESTFRRARRELIEKGWIKDCGRDFLSPVKGFDTAAQRNKSVKIDSLSGPLTDTSSIMNDRASVNNDAGCVNSDIERIKNDSVYIWNNQTDYQATYHSLKIPSGEDILRESIRSDASENCDRKSDQSGQETTILSNDPKCIHCSGKGFIPTVTNKPENCGFELVPCPECSQSEPGSI